MTDIVTVMEAHFEPKLFVISKRYNFNRQQGPRETIAKYVSQLRRLSEHCEFSNFLDEALRDQMFET